MSLSEIISALSFALDLVEDAKPGHAIRSCLLGMRIADALALGVSDSADLYYALLLMWRNSSPGAGLRDRLRRLVNMGLHHDQCNAQLIRIRCERGAEIVRKQGQSAALNVIVERSGRWFDPEIVRVVQSLAKQNLLWQNYDSGIERDIIRDMEPGYALRANEGQIDNIAEAFAAVVDAKSSFTFQHSLAVTEAAMRIAHELGLSPQRQKMIYRASLLHDLGKLRVSNSILDKSTKLDELEWAIVQEHPGLTREILGRIGAFSEIAEIAGNHHEKLDGSGYPFKLTGRDLSLDARILTVADIYGALKEDRPYRAGLSRESILSIMSQEIPHKLDSDCFEALISSLDGNKQEFSGRIGFDDSDQMFVTSLAASRSDCSAPSQPPAAPTHGTETERLIAESERAEDQVIDRRAHT